jgi:hypothetical protein
MLRLSESLFSSTKPFTEVRATERFLVAATSSWRSPASIVDTSASDWLNCRTVWSLSARVCMKPSSASTEPKSSSLLPASVALRREKSLMVWRNVVPWPPKLSAVTESRSDSAPVLLAPRGPSATLSRSRLS